jgi:UDP-N-acetyl-2-amino-2-deoxyglucuronate dehydrogenase
MRNFALLGAAGFIAPRHLAAIRETGQNLVAALDPSDSVGILDSYFPDAAFFTEFERFDRHIDKLRRAAEGKVDYVSVCSPNYLHDAHIRFGLRSDADVICEKPLVINPWNIDGLVETESIYGRKVNTILQLRVHPQIVALREVINTEPLSSPKHEIDLTYVTSRGRWYLYSWKGDD